MKVSQMVRLLKITTLSASSDFESKDCSVINQPILEIDFHVKSNGNNHFFDITIGYKVFTPTERNNIFSLETMSSYKITSDKNNFKLPLSDNTLNLLVALVSLSIGHHSGILSVASSNAPFREQELYNLYHPEELKTIIQSLANTNFN